ncbi:uncharacterized protein LOC124692761 [Lolium rigidum]|uniref:uncharacterized protein LOC124692761 n=1 Tax=Lolium rigidum TaxID=89674 RepID=UPI001F5D7462|nr:uncharacterized protein LOC124692761 [Lolium rigidum]
MTLYDLKLVTNQQGQASALSTSSYLYALSQATIFGCDASYKQASSGGNCRCYGFRLLNRMMLQNRDGRRIQNSGYFFRHFPSLKRFRLIVQVSRFIGYRPIDAFVQSLICFFYYFESPYRR